MIITRTPFRISFFGGGTDFPEFFREYGRGAVLGTAIDQYILHTVSPFLSHLFDYSIRLAYRKVECVNNVDDIEHSPFKACLKYLGITKDIEIGLTSNLPSFSGMGSSSSFTVGLLNALLAHQGRVVPKLELALMAIEIEREILGESVGCQDQVFAAIGGFNIIEFRAPLEINIHKIPMSKDKMAEFKSNLMIFFTGIKRRANDLEEKKLKRLSEISTTLKEMLSLVDDGYRILTGSGDLSDFGIMLDTTWRLKRQLESNVSNTLIDNMYNQAISAGALGGKLLGAGGGGFMLFYVPPERQDKVRNALIGYHEINVGINAPGSSLIYS